MEIVIKIPDKKYEALKMLESATIGLHLGVVEKAIINGTPLPKGHGRLVDMDAVLRHIKEPLTKAEFMIRMSAEKVLEANKEGAEE